MSKRSEEAAMKAYPVKGEWVGNQYGEWNADINRFPRTIFQEGYEQAEKELGWHSVDECLPEIGEEVIALTNQMNGKTLDTARRICYAHRPDPKGWDGRSLDTGEVKHYDVVTYDGWNIPGVRYWMPCPKLPEP